MLYPKGPLREALAKDPGLQLQVFEALQRITPAQLLAEGRVYGGGLHKLEPNELANAPADKLIAVLPELSLDPSPLGQLRLLEGKESYITRSASKSNRRKR